jgi:hypothetical protein
MAFSTAVTISRMRKVRPSVLQSDWIFGSARLGAQNHGQLTVAIDAAVIHFDDDHLLEAWQRCHRDRRWQRVEVAQMWIAPTL